MKKKNKSSCWKLQVVSQSSEVVLNLATQFIAQLIFFSKKVKPTYQVESIFVATVSAVELKSCDSRVFFCVTSIFNQAFKFAETNQKRKL